MSKYTYAYQKFSAAVESLATGPGDVRSRLLTVFSGWLNTITEDHLPESLREDWRYVEKSIRKYKEFHKGDIVYLDQQFKKSPDLKEKLAHLYPDPLEATMRRIKRNTGVKIARKIYNIYDELETRSQEKRL